MKQAITSPRSASSEKVSIPQEVHWSRSEGLVDYATAVRFMEHRVEQIAAGTAPELIWLLEHPSLYTAGTSARPQDLLDPDRFPVHQAGRGGQYTYHGPGQRVVYVMLDLKRRGGDVRAFVKTLETWVISTLAEFGVTGMIRPDRIGVWVQRPGLPQDLTPQQEDKIAAIGIRVRRWISFHGLSLNVSPELDHFDGIVPCGIKEYGVTSLKALERLRESDALADNASDVKKAGDGEANRGRSQMIAVDQVLLDKFKQLFSVDRLVPEDAPKLHEQQSITSKMA